MGTGAPMLALLPALMGAVVTIAVVHLWLWLGPRRDLLPLWVAAWCGATLLYLVGRQIQLTAGTPADAIAGARLAWLAALALLPVVMCLGHTLAGQRPATRVTVPVALVNAVLAVLVWTTELFVTHELSTRTDLLMGVPFLSPLPGPLAPLLAPYILAVFVYVWRTSLRHLSAIEPAERRMVRVGFALYVVFAINDALYAARLLETVRLFDFGFVAVAAGLSHLFIRRYNRLQAHLEEEVSQRTQELESRRAELGALVRAGQTVMVGLDLEATLQRIVEEARRITGTPHIALLLVDRDARVLRVGARSGGVVAAEPPIPLGGTLSGMVAATGAPVFVADTQNDPRSALAERERAEGIRTYMGLPVRKGDEVLGVLTIGTESPHGYTAEEMSYLSSFADQAAIAVDNARLYGAAQQRERRLHTLTTLTQTLTATLSVDELLDRVVRQAVELFGSSVARLWLLDESGQELHLRAHAGAASEVTGVTRLAVGEGVMGRIVATRAPVVIRDLAAFAAARNTERHRAEGVASFAGVPLLLGDRILGALGIAVREERDFADEDMRLLQSLANHAAIAIENARLYREIAQRGERLATMVRVARRLTSGLELQEVLRSIATAAAETFGGEAGFRILEGTSLVRAAATPGAAEVMSTERIEIGQSASGRAAATGEPVVIADVAADPSVFQQHRERSRPDRTGSLMCLPVRSGARILGTLNVYGVRGHRFDEAAVALAMSLADQAGIALENARLYAALKTRLDRLETLTRLNRLISSSLDMKQVLQEIARTAAQLVDVAAASFWVADESARTLELLGFSAPDLDADYPIRAIPYGRGLIGRIAVERRPVHTPDIVADGQLSPVTLDWARRHGVRSYYGVPVLHEGSLLAVLGLMGRQPFSLDPEAESLLQAFVAQAAVAVRNAAIFEAEGAARREAELALAQVKQLQGMLPICAYCKKIRNDRNYWETIEGYIGERSQATFSHGICPECRETVVAPQLEEFRRRRGEGP